MTLADASAFLITPRWIAPVTGDTGVLIDHSVIVRGERIEAVLPTAQARARHPQLPETLLPETRLSPGLVNAHSHAAMALLRGVADDLPLERWLNERIWPMEAALMSPEFVRDGSLLACHEMLLAGVTTFNDMYFFPQATAQAALTLGMRAVIGLIVIDFPSAWGSGPQEYLARGLAVRDAFRHEPRIGFSLAPHAPYSVSDRALDEVARLSAELHLPVHIHVHETAREVADHVARHGVRPLARLAGLGLVGPDLIAVHAVHLDDSEIELLATHGASVAHCPHSNLKLGSGIAPVAKMLERGVNVAIGTDGSASNNRLDLLQETRTAKLLAKGVSGDASVFNAHQALRAATLDGARALGWADRIGSIEPGKFADLVAIDLSDDGLSGIHDPVSHLFFAAGSHQVSHVWVAGESVVVKRQMAHTAARDAIAELRARRVVWHNRLGQFVPGSEQAFSDPGRLPPS
jgi:5-methylthioadenosine/S-adenosylhomocysteine deaminase